ncbi:MAG TPA: ribulose-phosphate 3-epimerase [Bacilli bacterium]|nr:ribulose-phosphate 3-epimerase [Bacilli bacterium]
MKISVSFMKSLLSCKEAVKKIDATDCDYIHVDIMDGKFTKEKNYTIGELKSILSNTTKKLDVHLMVKNPQKYINDLATFNIEYITFHYESVSNPLELINYIKNFGIKVGLAIKPKTKIKKIRELIPYLDLIVVMGVEPGKGGQALIPKQLDKINELESLKFTYNFKIALDGGINEENIVDVAARGVDMIMVGSFITMSDNYQEQINKLKNKIV